MEYGPMADPHHADPANSRTSRWLPYALIGVSLPLGLLFVFVRPTSWPTLDYLAGGALIAVALGGVTYLVVRHSGPGDRGPDF